MIYTQAVQDGFTLLIWVTALSRIKDKTDLSGLLNQLNHLF
jgi:hypothetical protein